MKLYTYFRSSAAYRVRIALNLKELDYEAIPVHLRNNGGEHRQADFLAVNPQGLVPVLEDGATRLIQSMAIIEYLDEMFPLPPFLPVAPLEKARVRAFAQLIASDIHPLNNLRVLQYLRRECAQDQGQVNRWYEHWVHRGFDALEQMVKQTAGRYCYGDTITLADICLAPQYFNAQRLPCDLSAYPTLKEINQNLEAHPAFAAAAPSNQPDAE